MTISEIPAAFREDIQRATEILKGVGCTDVYLFGSLVNGEAGARSDIDLAVRGCPKNRFFQALGKLLVELDRPVDLVDLDQADAFAKYLEANEELVRVA